MIQSVIGSYIIFLLFTSSELIGVESGRHGGGGGGRHGGGGGGRRGGGGWNRGGGGNRHNGGGWNHHGGGGNYVPFINQPYTAPSRDLDYDYIPGPGDRPTTAGCAWPSLSDNAKFEIEDCRGDNYCSNPNSIVPLGKRGVITCTENRRQVRLTTTCTEPGNWIPVQNCETLFNLLDKYKENTNQPTNNPVQVYNSDTTGNKKRLCSKVTVQKSGSSVELYCFNPGSVESSTNSDDCVDNFNNGAPEGAKIGARCRAPLLPVENTVKEIICKNGEWIGSIDKVMCRYSESPTSNPTTTLQPIPEDNSKKTCSKILIKQLNPSYLVTCSVPGKATVDDCAEYFVTPVPTGTKISMKCRPPYIPSTPYSLNERLCLNGEWTGEFKKPSCTLEQEDAKSKQPPNPKVKPPQETRPTNSVTCPPLKARSPGVQLTCVFGSGREVHTNDCNTRLPIGTEAKYICAQYYEAGNTALSTLYRKCKSDGTWSGTSDFSCIVECGRENILKTPFITHGSPTLRGQFPWHAGIFRNSSRNKNSWEYICGATLLSKKALVTAGHCVTMLQTTETLDHRDMQIHLGKFKRTDNDENVQIKGIKHIKVEPNYNPYNYDSDLAILILKTEVTIGYFVRPICFLSTSDSALEDLQLADNSIGTVVGWGYDENNKLADELRMARLRVVSSRECSKEMIGSAITQLNARSTTYCAGYNNGTNVCNGDSGSGMYFPTKETDNVKWYIQGLVSVGIAHENGRCKPEELSVFTRLGRYADFITKTLSENDAI